MIDLHMHSTFSDGTHPPEELARLAGSFGLTAIALTDHDCMDGVECTEEEYQVNRRTEFKVTGVISEGSSSSLDKYVEGDEIPKNRFGIGYFEVCSK